MNKQRELFFGDYKSYTTKTSEINRTLALAGVAIIWIFNKTDVHGNLQLPTELITPLKWFVFVLLADLLQYFLAGLIWWIHFKIVEFKQKKITVYSIFAYFLHMFYFLKIFFCFYAYWNLLKYFRDTLQINIFSF